MSTDWRQERLPCGAPLGGIVDQVARGLAARRDAHQRTCRYCTAALAEAERAWGPVRELAAEHVEPPQGLVDAILRRVTRLAEAGLVTLARGARGVTEATAWVLALLAETAAEATPGVHRAGGGFGRLVDRIRGDGQGPDAVDVTETGDQVVEVDIDVVAEYGDPLPDISAAIRRNVRHQVATLTGLEVAGVNVTVTDLRMPPSEGAQ